MTRWYIESGAYENSTYWRARLDEIGSWQDRLKNQLVPWLGLKLAFDGAFAYPVYVVLALLGVVPRDHLFTGLLALLTTAGVSLGWLKRAYNLTRQEYELPANGFKKYVIVPALLDTWFESITFILAAVIGIFALSAFETAKEAYRLFWPWRHKQIQPVVRTAR